jgi:hypothetical protein
MESVTDAKDRGKSVDIIYLDFSKAFDKVPHRKLVAKLRAKGVSEEIVCWIESWLGERTQQVRVGGELSEEGEVGSGVPQGTVLGPCLFTVYIDDIDVCIVGTTNIIKFADDTKCWKVIENDNDRADLQKTLDNMCSWAERWGMCFNAGKCKVMHIGTNNPRYKYYMNGEELGCTNEEKDVGVYINTTLKPSSHCKRTANKAMAVLTQITRNFHYRDRHTFLKLYKQYVRPHLEFASPAWSPWLSGDIAVLEKVQEKALKMTSGLKATTYEERCREVGLETLAERRKIQDMSQVFKIMKGIDKIDQNKVFAPRQTNQNTRNASNQWNLARKNARTDVRLQSFGLRVVEEWNSLPEETKKLDKLPSFKLQLRRGRENGQR